MRDVITNSVYFGVAISLFSFAVGVRLKKKFEISIVNAFLVRIVFVIFILAVFKIDYDCYNLGGKYLC